MSRPRYRVQPLRERDGTPAAWGVFLRSRSGGMTMATVFTGAFAWWRAKRHASALNRKG